MSFKYVIDHIPGHLNEWADALSRWGLHQPRITLRRFSVAQWTPLRPFIDDGYSPPSIEEIRDSQQHSLHDPTSRPDLVCSKEVNADDANVLHNDRWWIPEDDHELWTRLLIVSHCGSAGHRGVAATAKALGKYVSCRGFRERVVEFCKSCLLCLQSKGGHTIPRPLGRQLVAEKPNRVLHLDYFYVGPADNGWTYVLVLIDGCSGFLELKGTGVANSEVVVETLLDWFKRFGIVPIWVSDRGSHFTSKVLLGLRDRLGAQHHFTTAYCPWANGTAERPNREITATMRAIMAEFDLPFSAWPIALPIVQYALNNAPSERRAGYAPVQLHTGAQPSGPLTAIFEPRTQEYINVPLTSDALARHYNQLLEELETMHDAANACGNKRHDKRTARAVHANFHIGDYVLWSRIDSQQTHDKLTFVWRGPFQVVSTRSEWVFVIKHVVSGKEYTVHSTRLKFYHDRSLNVSHELIDHVSNQGFDFDVDRINNLRWNATTKKYELEVVWLGFECLDNTWEPFVSLWTSIPILVMRYLCTCTDSRLLRRLYRKHRKIIDAGATKHHLDLSCFKSTRTFE